jgi:hypothetical protein
VDDLIENAKIFARGSEIEELYMFYFILLYMVILHRRIAYEKSFAGL